MGSDASGRDVSIVFRHELTRRAGPEGPGSRRRYTTPTRAGAAMPTSLTPPPSLPPPATYAEDRAARAPRRHGAPGRAVGDRGAQPRRASGRQCRRAREAVRVHRLQPLHRALDDDHARDPDRSRLSPGRRRTPPKPPRTAVYIEGIFTPPNASAAARRGTRSSPGSATASPKRRNSTVSRYG